MKSMEAEDSPMLKPDVVLVTKNYDKDFHPAVVRANLLRAKGYAAVPYWSEYGMGVWLSNDDVDRLVRDALTPPSKPDGV